MRKEELLTEIAKVVGSVVLFTLSLLLSIYLSFPLEALVSFQALTNKTLWVVTFSVTTISLLGAYIATRIKERKVGVFILLLTALVVATLLNLSELDSLIIISIVIAATIVKTGDIKSIGDILSKIRKIKSLSSFIFLTLLIFLILPNGEKYNDSFLHNIISFINEYSLTPSSMESLIDQLVPPYITSEDRNYIMSYLTSLKEWNSLSEEQKQLVIKRMEESVLKQKEVIRNLLKNAFSETNVKLDKKTLLMLVSSNPQLKNLIDYLYVLVIFFALTVYSIISEIASIIVFVLISLSEIPIILGRKKQETNT